MYDDNNNVRQIKQPLSEIFIKFQRNNPAKLHRHLLHENGLADDASKYGYSLLFILFSRCRGKRSLPYDSI